MRYGSLLVAVLLLGLTSCSDESIIGPDAPEATAQAAENEWVAAKQDGKMVPIKADASYVVNLEGGMIDCLIDGVVVGAFPTQLDGTGTFSHLGRTTSLIIAETCAVDPLDGTLFIDGYAHHRAANGDVLYADYEGAILVDGTIVFDVITFEGGTGRFEAATGSASGGGSNDIDTGTGTYWFSGMITY